MAALAAELIHPHQWCGYSDSPFARKDTFLYCRVWKWVGGNGSAVSTKVDPKKKTLCSYRNIYWGRQTGWKTCAGSAGIDNEAHWSCKRRVTAKFVQNDSIWIKNLKNQGFYFLDSGIPKFSRRRPMPASSLVSFAQETIFHTPINQNNSKNMRVVPRRALTLVL